MNYELTNVLPVTAHKAELVAAIRAHPVIVVCGETGSGKTTQIPQICLEAGRGQNLPGGNCRLIGCTQPRRVAALTVAERVARELGPDGARLVGWQHRFARHTSRDNRIKFMTDGILLAELRHDPLLRAYDTLMVDEAHERTLNIDFILGCLKRILPRRPDLRVIVSSATLETSVFADFFDHAPVINIPGRTYPVEVRYREPDADDNDLARLVANAVDEIRTESDTGDILVFLPGERDIRAAAETLRGRTLPHTAIIPLMASLPAAEQRRAFQLLPGTQRIILSTNVAETSVTLPGIRYVIDSGLARISRYNPRARVKRLHIEPISQASADQRKGRCGRIGPGTCIRLYAQDDFARRPAFTEPEIRRTSLAGTILSMLDWRLGDIATFPFLQPPAPAATREGYKDLLEIGAIRTEGAARTGEACLALTKLGTQIAKLPLEPRLSRILLAAAEEDKSGTGALPDALIVVAALSCEDPLIRPADKLEESARAHAKFKTERSDFAAIINLWRFLHDPATPLSRTALRKRCTDHYISYRRLAEWEDVHEQLTKLVKQLPAPRAAQNSAFRTPHSELRVAPRAAQHSAFRTPHSELRVAPAGKAGGDDALHRAMLTGLLANIGTWDPEEREYKGANGTRFSIFPGSGLYKKPPQWIVASELVDTSRLFARRAAAIDPDWIEPLARHLCKYSYHSPYWDETFGTARALRRVTLHGLLIQDGTRCDLSRIDPDETRALFIRHGLVGGRLPRPIPKVVLHNLDVIRQRTAAAHKTRSADPDAEAETFIALYDEKLPRHIVNLPALRKALAAPDTATELAQALRFTDADFEDPPDSANGFPDHATIAGIRIPLRYRHNLGGDDDGITATVPIPHIPLLRFWPADRLVPGALKGKLETLLRRLDKPQLHRIAAALNPPVKPRDTGAVAESLLPLLPPDTPLAGALAQTLGKHFGIAVLPDHFAEHTLPPEFQIRWRIVNDKKAQVFASRSLSDVYDFYDELRTLAPELVRQDTPPLTRYFTETRDITTPAQLPALPEKILLGHAGRDLFAYPALHDDGASVSTRLFITPAEARAAHANGIRRLIHLSLKDWERRHPAGKNTNNTSKKALSWQSLQRLEIPARGRVSNEFSLIPAQPNLAADILDGAIRATFLSPSNAALPRDAQALAVLIAAKTPAFHTLAKQLHTLAHAILHSARDCETALEHAPNLPQDTVCDIAEQLGFLLFPGFAARVPLARLTHYPRYLEAIQKRIERAGADPAKEQQKNAAFKPLWDRYTAFVSAAAKPPHNPVALDDYRWQLEEYRVSLRAQELKTPAPVSEQRLEKLWGDAMRFA